MSDRIHCKTNKRLDSQFAWAPGELEAIKRTKKREKRHRIPPAEVLYRDVCEAERLFNAKRGLKKPSWGAMA